MIVLIAVYVALLIAAIAMASLLRLR